MNIGKIAKAAYYEQTGTEKINQNRRDFNEDLLKSLNDNIARNSDDSTLLRSKEVSKEENNDDTENEPEKNSLEAWRNALSAYEDYVQDRIENGPEKFQIGSSEFSIEEWDKLMEKIDKDIDIVKEEQKERLEKEEARTQEEKLYKKIENSTKNS